MKTLLAQQLTIGGTQIQGPLDSSISTVSDLINVLIKFLIPVAAIILFFVIVSGGFTLLTSGGVPDKIKSAQAKLTSGLIGFVLLIASYTIVKLLAWMFKLDIGFL